MERNTFDNPTTFVGRNGSGNCNLVSAFSYVAEATQAQRHPFPTEPPMPSPTPRTTRRPAPHTPRRSVIMRLAAPTLLCPTNPRAAILATAAATAAALALAAARQPAAARLGDVALSIQAFLPAAWRAVALADLPAAPTALPATETVAAPAPTDTPSPVPTDPPTPTDPPEPTPTPRACPPLAERVTVASSDVGAPMRANDEYFPVVVAPRAGGGSLVAWREQRAATVRVGRFDAAGRLAGTPLAFPAEEVHALVAHDDGGALVVVDNDPDIYSPKYCRGPSTPDKALCAKLDVWRFGDDGRTRWRTTVTDKTNVDKDGAHFIWWYQRTARLAWTGAEYLVYYRAADSSPRPGVPREIDIHTGDAFAFVGADGERGRERRTSGCSHSWAVRLAFNGRFGSACHGDAYPNAFHVIVAERGRRLGASTLHANLDPTKRALGGLVPTAEGFWLLHMAQAARMELHLAFFDNAGKVTRDTTVAEAVDLETAYPFRAYLAEYGADGMLAGWMSAGKLQLAVLSRATGALLEGPVGVDARIDKWVELVPYPNGDVGWAWNPGGTARLDLARVAACGGG